MPDLSTVLNTLPKDVQRTVANAALDATDTSVKQIVPSTPDVAWITYAPMIGKIITFVAGGFLLKWGIDVSAWTGEQWVQVIGPVVILGGLVWAWIGKQLAAWREHQIALASAAASAAATQAQGTPVEVAVQPPPAKA